MVAPHEHRRSRRIQVQGEVDAVGTLPFKATVVNLSREGVCMEHTAKLERGQMCELRFRIPPMTFTVQGRIVWSTPHPRGGGLPGGAAIIQSGAEFVAISADVQRVIDTIVARPPEPAPPAAPPSDPPTSP